MGISSGLIHSALLGGPAVPANWTPAILSPQLWLEADVGVTTSGANVTGWADQSGHGVDLAPSGTATFEAAGLNGLPSILLNGAGKLISANNALTLGNATASLYAVCQVLTGAGNNGRLISISTNGGTDYNDVGSGIVYFNSGGVALDGYLSNGLRFSQPISLDTSMRFGVIFDGSAPTPYVNNVAGTTGGAFSTAFAATRSVALGDHADTSNTEAIKARYSAVLITNTALSSTDRSNLHSYWGTKWGF